MTPDQAAVVVTIAALRTFTSCAHGETQLVTCSQCERLEPLVHLALEGGLLLCPAAADEDPAVLHAALELVAAAANTSGRRDLARLAGQVLADAQGGARR